MVVVYRTSNYEKKLAKDPSRSHIIEKKLNDLDNRSRLEHYSKNPKCYDKKGVWVYKFQGLGQNMRLVLEEIKDESGKHQLIIVRDYIAQNEYEPKWRMIIEPIIASGKFLDSYPLDKLERVQAENYFHTKINPEKRKKEELPGSLKNWLVDFGINNQFDIYESNIWPKYQNNIEGTFSSYIFEILKKICGEGVNNQFTKRLSSGYRNVYVHSEFGISLVFDYIILDSNTKPLLLLHGWVSERAHHELDELIREVLEYAPLSRDQKEYSFQSVTYSAFKGYPSTILASLEGSKRWKEIQSASNRSNLALSPEQVKFLNKVEFPKFINGQAGSGKSEMLMYMLSELHFRKELDDFTGYPLFLTENNELLERAKTDAQIKLLYNSRYQDYGMNVSDIRSNFFTFKDFLRENFIDEDDEVFNVVINNDNYINFYKFKRLYENSYLKKSIKKNYPAELSWFVINTFIRGYSIENDEFTIEDFSRLARRDKSYISDEIFKGVFTYVYLPFYQKLIQVNKYWDRLSLIRFIWEKYSVIPQEKKVTIILCDEAQDFTRLELQFLLKLSVYSDYDVEEIEQVPIAFAGDPFQTVNPTGFNLAQIDRLFSGELIDTYDILNEESFIYNLLNNYRSTPEIVNLANTVQFMRYRFLEHSELDRAQKSRRLSSKKIPILLRIENVDQESLLEKTSLMVYISACDNGEESEFLKRDDLLNENIVLKSASLSKGNEYDNVVIYKFGQSFSEEFGETFLSQLLSGAIKFSELNPGLQFRLTYFFNKLYVAVTRAREEVLILDTDLGSRSFWEEIKNRLVLEDSLLESWGYIDLSALFIEANNLKILSDISLEEGFKNAQTEIEQGEIHRDSEKMILAAKWLQKINYSGKHENLINYCRARAYEYSEELVKAGDVFATCGPVEGIDTTELASDCYWRGGYWQKLLDLFAAEMFSDSKQEIRILVANIMLKYDFDIQKVIKHGSRIHEALEGSNKYSKLRWEDEFYNTFISVLTENKSSYIGRNKELADALNSFKIKNNDLRNLVASLYFSAQEYLKAFDIWSAIANTDHPNFYVAALEVKTGFNERLIYLNKLENYEQIEEAYIPGKRNLDENSIELLMEIFYKKRMTPRKVAQVLHESKRAVLDFGNLLEKDTESKKAIYFFGSVVSYMNPYEDAIPKENLYRNLLEIGINLLSVHLGSRVFNLLTSGLLFTRNWRVGKTPKGLLTFLEKDGKGFEFYYSLMKCLANSNINIKDRNRKYEFLVQNFINLLQNSGNTKNINIDFIILTACVDKAIEKYSVRQRIYAESKGLFLKSRKLDRFDRSIIEERFWYCRFLINSREMQGDNNLRQSLRRTYNMKAYREVDFLVRAATLEDVPFSFYDKLKSSPTYSDLIESAKKTKLLGVINRGDNRYDQDKAVDVETMLKNLDKLPPEKRAEILKLLTSSGS